MVYNCPWFHFGLFNWLQDRLVWEGSYPLELYTLVGKTVNKYSAETCPRENTGWEKPTNKQARKQVSPLINLYGESTCAATLEFGGGGRGGSVERADNLKTIWLQKDASSPYSRRGRYIQGKDLCLGQKNYFKTLKQKVRCLYFFSLQCQLPFSVSLHHNLFTWCIYLQINWKSAFSYCTSHCYLAHSRCSRRAHYIEGGAFTDTHMKKRTPILPSKFNLHKKQTKPAISPSW